ncbi:hypothetical protein CSKR_201425 [Clonorchis sinensis]|uniref:Uncharacterized protein n=1 Tax=Clonorchis sinensis TaxID=79923 RepID=A0A8T1MRB8_CLOSI|nr:hypothetical protein CSKR_201425 [Clonorchis sinensis]
MTLKCFLYANVHTDIQTVVHNLFRQIFEYWLPDADSPRSLLKHSIKNPTSALSELCVRHRHLAPQFGVNCDKHMLSIIEENYPQYHSPTNSSATCSPTSAYFLVLTTSSPIRTQKETSRANT